MRNRAWTGVLLIGILAASMAAPFGTSAQDAVWLPIAIAGLVCPLLGIRWFHPADRRAFQLYSTAAGAFIVESLLIGVGLVKFPTWSYPSPPNVAGIAGNALLTIAAFRLVSRRTHGRDPTNKLDSYSATAAVAALQFSLVVLTVVRSDTLEAQFRYSAITFSVLSLMGLAALCRLALGPGPRNLSFYLLAAASASNVALETVIIALFPSRGNEAPTASLPTMLSQVSFILLVAAVLHPSMRDLAEPGDDPVARMTAPRLVILLSAALTPPILLLVQGTSDVVETRVIIVTWLVIITMVVFRMAGLVRAWQRAWDIEQLLAQCSAGLASSSTAIEMTTVTLTAVQGLGKGVGTRATILQQSPLGWAVVASSDPVRSEEATHFSIEPSLLVRLDRDGAAIVRDTAPPDSPDGESVDFLGSHTDTRRPVAGRSAAHAARGTR